VIFASKIDTIMKRKLMTILIAIAAILMLLLTIGLLLPAEREFVKEAILPSPTDKVFHVVTNVTAQTNWRSDVREIIVIDAQTWTEIPQKGTPITFRTKRKVEHEVFEIEIIDPQSINGYWEGTFEAVDENTTKVVFKEVICIENPIFRLVSYVFVNLDQTMEDYMTNLKTQLGN
jgi:hypothetical protein